MGDKSAIEWTDATWNPIVGCSLVSPGCTHCYAMAMAARLEKMLPPERRGEAMLPNQYAALTTPSKAGPVWTGRLNIAPDHILTAPLRWKRPRRIFVNSMGDLFHESAPDEWIDRVFAVMALAPQHTFQVLTKRSARMREYVSNKFLPYRIAPAALRVGRYLSDGHIGWSREYWKPSVISGCTAPAQWPIPNVWLGVSAEDQRRADERIPDLLATPAAVRFVSAEPLLGSLHLGYLGWPGHAEKPARRTGMSALTGARYVNGDFVESLPRLDWIIVGGESGSGARPMHPDWVRSIRDQCAAAGVPFFFKQWGEWSGTHPDWPRAVPTVMAGDGTLYSATDLAYPDGPRRGAAIQAGHDHGQLTNIYRVGKRGAGRLLDGREHSEFPAAQIAEAAQ